MGATAISTTNQADVEKRDRVDAFHWDNKDDARSATTALTPWMEVGKRLKPHWPDSMTAARRQLNGYHSGPPQHVGQDQRKARLDEIQKSRSWAPQYGALTCHYTPHTAW